MTSLSIAALGLPNAFLKVLSIRRKYLDETFSAKRLQCRSCIPGPSNIAKLPAFNGEDFGLSKSARAASRVTATQVSTLRPADLEASEAREHGELFGPFVSFTLDEFSQRMNLWDYPVPDELRSMSTVGSKGQPAVTKTTSMQSEKLRHIRSCHIVAGKLEVLNLVIFPRSEYQAPIFCADLVALPTGNLIIIDLNPLHHTEEYLDRYIRPLLPSCNPWIEQLPWGGEITGEALRFFSPALIWARPGTSEEVMGPVFGAFQEYLRLWLDLVEAMEPETDPVKIEANREAERKYLVWRCVKDPGRPMMTRLYGPERCEDFIQNFLFAGMEELGVRPFLHYFPEYANEKGETRAARSVVGKVCKSRPWDSEGRLLTGVSFL